MDLKALIVDDEPYIRKGILNKINWNELGIDTPAEANDGVEAMEFLKKNKVDLVLTDIKMPGMDGIKFIEEAKKYFGDRHKFVIISGYGEFGYAREAIKLGVTDYLLKPIKEGELEDTVRKIVSGTILDNKEKDYKKFLETNYKNNRVMLRDKLLNELMEGCSDEAALKENLRAFKIELPFENFLVALFKLEPLNSGSKAFTDKDGDLILFAVRNILEEVFSAYEYSCIFKNSRSGKEFVVVFNFHKDSNKQLIKKLSTEAIKQVERCLKFKSSVGIGNICRGLGEVHRGFSQAGFAVKEKLLKGTGRVFDVEELNACFLTENIINDEFKKLLNRYLQECKKDSVIRLIEGLFDKILNNSKIYNHALVREICLEFYMFLSDYLKNNNKNANELLGEKFEFLESLMELDSLDGISLWLKKCCNTVMDFVSKDRKMTGEEIVQEVKNYIDMRYSEDISLSFISQKYFIHPNYFCRIFRNIIGESFSDYLTRIRMVRAGELLRSSGLKLNRICEIVGYDDPRYFSQVFKRFFGVSPSEYQSSRT